MHRSCNLLGSNLLGLTAYAEETSKAHNRMVVRSSHGRETPCVNAGGIFIFNWQRQRRINTRFDCLQPMETDPCRLLPSSCLPSFDRTPTDRSCAFYFLRLPPLSPHWLPWQLLHAIFRLLPQMLQYPVRRITAPPAATAAP